MRIFRDILFYALFLGFFTSCGLFPTVVHNTTKDFAIMQNSNIKGCAQKRCTNSLLSAAEAQVKAGAEAQAKAEAKAKAEAQQKAAKVDRFIKTGQSYIQSLKDKAASSKEARLWLTLKVFPSQDNTFQGWTQSLTPTKQLLKFAFTADDQWASSFASSYKQLMNFYIAAFGDNAHHACWDLDFTDVIFVQSLKDARGREVEIDYLNDALAGMGYAPVTPGFWIKLHDQKGNLKPFAQWVRAIFGTNLEMRSRARGISTTPFVAELDRDANGNRVRYFLQDVEAQGQKGADGGNEYSHTLQLKGAPEAIAQIRVHPVFLPTDGVDNDSFQAKGKIHAVKAWAVRKGDKWFKITEDEVQYLENRGQLDRNQLVSAFFIHYDNVKGSLKDEVEALAANLERDELLDLQEWWYSRSGLSSVVAEEHRVFTGGIIAEDNSKSSSSVGWQDLIIRSVSAIQAQESDYRAQLEKTIGKIYTANNPMIDFLFESESDKKSRKALKASAAAMAALNPKKVSSTIFGQGRKSQTQYCDQIAMPSAYSIVKNRPKDAETINVGGLEFDAITVTGQPQLYHQCIVVTAAISHKMVDNCFWVARRIHKEGDAGSISLTPHEKKFLLDLKDFIVAELQSESSDTLDDGVIHEELYRRLRAIWISIHSSPNLIWMSKANQDRLQRDSDGDKLLIDQKAWIVKAAKVHIEATKGLPMPRVEVTKATPYDGDLTVMKAKCFSFSNEMHKMACFKYVCAPNQGQGPTGVMVNLASAVLAHIVWQDENGGWGPDPKVRKMALKFYAQMILLVQNAIDRQKKPWEVCSLINWPKLTDDIYNRPVVGGVDYVKADMKESFPSMKLGASVRQIPVRLNTHEQYNVAALKPFVAWSINFINARYEFNDIEHWVEAMNKIASLFGELEIDDEGNIFEPDWVKIKELLGDTHRTPEEIKAQWLFPDRAYAWIKEASFETPLHDAPPAVKLMSQWVVETNTKVRADLGIEGSPSKVLHRWWVQNLGTNKALLKALPPQKTTVWFLKSLISSYLALKAQENAGMAQSEFFMGRGENDVNEFLNKLKDALRDLDDSVTNNGAYRLAHAALLQSFYGANSESKATSLKAFALMLYSTWAQTGYNEWLQARHPLTALGMIAATNDSAIRAAVDELRNSESDSEGNPFLKAFLETLGLASNSPTSQKKLESFIEVLAGAYRESRMVSEEDLLKIHGVGPVICAKLQDLVNSATLSDAKSHWAEIIWSDFFPALKAQLELAETSDLKKKYFVDEGGIEKLLSSLQNDTVTNDVLMPLFKDIIDVAVAKEADALAKDPEFIELLSVAQQLGDPLKLKSFLLGFAKRRGALPRVRELMQAGAPVMQGLRLKALLMMQAQTVGIDVTAEEFAQTLRSLLVDETVGERVVDGDTVPYKLTRLRGNVDYPIVPKILAPLAGQLASKTSFYLLQETENVWFDKSGALKGVGSSVKRWVLHDKMQYALDGQDPEQTILDELNARFAIGHSFSLNELKVLKSIAEVRIKVNSSNISAQLALKLAQAKLQSAEAGNYAVLSYGQESKTPNGKLADNLCMPYHWGGNAKSQGRWGWRSSAYRPIWRFVMAVLGENTTVQKDGMTVGFTEATLTNARFELFERLSGATFSTKVKRSQEEQAALTLEAITAEASNMAVASGKQGQRSPDRNPVSCMVNLNGEKSWLKIPTSPAHEVLGHITWCDGRKGALLKDLDSKEPAAFVHLNPAGELSEVIDFSDYMSFYRLKMVRQAVIDCEVLKVNGVKSPAILLSEIRAAVPGKVDGDLVNCFGINVEYKYLAEFALGLMHVTSAWDSYVLSNLTEHTSRLGSKTPNALKRFFRQDEGTGIKVKFPSGNALARLIEKGTHL